MRQREPTWRWPVSDRGTVSSSIPEKTVVDNIGEGKQEVMVRRRSRPSSATCRTSCSSPSRGGTPVKALSGAKNRLLLAKLFPQTPVTC